MRGQDLFLNKTGRLNGPYTGPSFHFRFDGERRFVGIAFQSLTQAEGVG